MPNLIHLTGLYSIVVLPVGVLHPKITASCKTCQSISARHCAHPEECGQWTNNLTYTLEEVGYIGDHTIVCVPEHNDYHIPLEGHYTAIGFPADVSEEECREIMDIHWTVDKREHIVFRKNGKTELMDKIRSIGLDPATSLIIKIEKK